MTDNHWPPRGIKPLRTALDELAESVANRPSTRSVDEQIWLTRFLVVRTCGCLEQTVREVARGYVQGKSGGLVRTFAHSWLEKSRTPSVDNLYDLVGRFDTTLRDELQGFLEHDDQRLHRELSFLVDRRHKIAHGLNEGLNSAKAISLKDDAYEIADWFIDNLNPNMAIAPKSR